MASEVVAEVRDEALLGTETRLVEADETAFGKRKYQKGTKPTRDGGTRQSQAAAVMRLKAQSACRPLGGHSL